MYPETNHFAHTQSRAVGSHQQHAMSGQARVGEQACNLFLAENLRELRRLAGSGDVERGLLPSEGLVVEEAQAGQGNDATTPRELSLPHEMKKVGLDFPIADAIRGTVVVGRQSGDRPQIAALGLRGHTAEGHVVDHAGSKFAHGGGPPCAVERGA